MKIYRFLKKDIEKSLLFISENVIVCKFSNLEPVTKYIMYILVKIGIVWSCENAIFCSTTLFLFSRMWLLLGPCLKPSLCCEWALCVHTHDLWVNVTSRDGRQESHGFFCFFFSSFFSIWAGGCLSQREKVRSAGRCKDGRATNAVRGRDPGRQESARGELPKPDPGSGLLREQLCPGKKG